MFTLFCLRDYNFIRLTSLSILWPVLDSWGCSLENWWGPPAALPDYTLNSATPHLPMPWKNNHRPYPNPGHSPNLLAWMTAMFFYRLVDGSVGSPPCVVFWFQEKSGAHPRWNSISDFFASPKHDCSQHRAVPRRLGWEQYLHVAQGARFQLGWRR